MRNLSNIIENSIEIEPLTFSIATSLGIDYNRTYAHDGISEYLTGRELIDGTASQARELDMTEEQIREALSGWEALPTTWYMEEHSGEVDTIEGWREDYEAAVSRGEAEELGYGSSFEDCLSCLIEVRRTETGEWMAV